MGDIVYPGILINRANPQITEKDVVEYFVNKLKLDNIRFGGLQVQIYGRKGGTTRVVVSGINMPFDQLRVACKKVFMMKGNIVHITNVDFGVQREPDGDMRFTHLSLHNHLKEGQGMRPPINILRRRFNDQFGNFGHHESTIYFDDVKDNVEKEMLKDFGKVFYTGNIVARGTGGRKFQDGKLEYSNMEIQFKNRMESLQAICVLNKNEKFSGLKKSFITKNDDKCRLEMKCGLGKNGEILDIESLVVYHRFVPLNAISDEIVCRRKIHQLTTFCSKCSKPYEIQGIGPDFSWLAARCGCSLHQLQVTWPNEEFVRMILPQARKTIFSGDDSMTAPNMDKLIVFARGLLPLYDSPLQFCEIAYAAFCLEYLFAKRQLREKKAVGILVEWFFVENYENKDKVVDWIYVLRIKVPKTKLWCEEGFKKMSKATIIPLTLNEQDPSSNVSSPLYSEAKNNEWIKASICEIVPSYDDPHSSIVTVRAIFHDRQNLKNLEHFKIIPKPSTTQRDAIRASTSKWEQRFQEKPQNKQFHNFSVHKAVKQDYDLEKQNVWKVHIEVNGIEFFAIMKRLLSSCYVGVDVGLFTQDDAKLGWKLETGRVTDYRFDSDLNGWIVEMIVLFPKSVTIMTNVLCDASFWILTRKFLHVKTAVKDNLILQTDFCEHRNTVNMDEALTKHLAAFQEIFDVKIDPTIGIGDITRIQSVVQFWKEHPKRDVEQLDFLLHRSNDLNHKLSIEYMGENKKRPDMQRLASLRRQLNPSQVTGIDNMLVNRLSILQGPPGTGKTVTVASGIVNCNLVDDGIIIACCPSNYACDVLYEKVKVVNQQHQVGLKVVRMQSISREKKMFRDISLDETDQTQLHVMVRKHPHWNSDPETNLIIDKSMRFNGALLTRNEKSHLDLHTLRIRKEILLETDVLVCTVGCASDGRIKSLLEDYRRSLASLVIDEASLLTVPACVPILAFNPTRVWLVGDHCQLRPSVLDDAAVASCLDVSWMEFLCLSPFVQPGVNFNMLNVQYRMASGIATVVSKFMYNNEVKSSDQVLARTYSTHPILKEYPDLGLSNIGCFNYDGDQERLDCSSYYNLKEVEITRDILLKLKLCDIVMSSVTIITMYASQSSYLTDMISELGSGFEDVKVQTVDSSQGTESPIVILNMVRSNSKYGNNGNVGFLRDQRRLNVAMSRSIDFLLLVCDVQTLISSKLPDILKLFNLLEEQNVDLNKM